MTMNPALSAADVIADAAALDRQDPLAHFRERFILNDEVRSYLDGNSLGRPLRATRDRLPQFVEEVWGGRLIRAWDEQWIDAPVVLGDRLGAAALGAAAGQTVVADSTTVLLYKLMRAAAAGRSDRTEVVADTENFPTDRFVLEGVAAEHGLTVRWITPDASHGVTEAQVREVLNEQTAFVLLSNVAFKSGFIADVSAITAAAHEFGALVLWDLCHSVGLVPMQLDAWGVDLAVGCSYKYLNGGPGAPAFAYVSTAAQQELTQPVQGWFGAADPFGMTETYVPARGIRQMISGTPPILGLQPISDMVDLIEEAGIDAIREKSIALTEFAAEFADAHLAHYGVRVISPRDPAIRGGHVTLDHPAFKEIVAALWERGIIPDFRPPQGIRIGLSPLSTSFAELAEGLLAIAECLEER